MNADERQPGKPPEGDPLDRLLAGAKWPEPTPESQQRLRTFWRNVSPANQRRAILRFVPRYWAAAAAVAAVAAAVVWVVVSRQHRPEPQDPVNLVKKPSTPAPVTVAPSTARERPPVVVVREPTNRERLAIAATVLQHRARQQQARQAAQVDEAVARLAGDPQVDLAAALAALTRAAPREFVASRLTSLARAGSGSHRAAAARLLGEMRLPATLPLFLELARDPATKDAAYPSIKRMADDATLARLAQSEPDGQHRRQLLATLIERERPGATVAYLRRVVDPKTADSALDALSDVKSPPVDALFQHLGHPETAVRLAAAKALGRINGPVVARRLADLVERDTHRREALAALMYSRGNEAARYLEAARRYPELADAITAVQVRVSRPF